CQTGDDALRSDVSIDSGSRGVEFFSQPVKFVESKTNGSAFVCYSKKIVTVGAESLSSLEVDTKQTKGVAAVATTLGDCEQHCIDSDQYILKCDGSHDNSFSDKSTVAEHKPDHDQSQLIANNSFGDSDIQSEVIVQNSRSSGMNSTTEDVKLKSEIGHGDTLGGNKKETLDPDLSPMTPLNVNSSPISETSYDNKTQAKILPEIKSTEKKHCKFIPVDTLSDLLNEEKQMIAGAVLPETNLQERCICTSEIDAHTADKNPYNTTTPTLITKQENQELSAEMVVAEYNNEALDHKLSYAMPTENSSKFDDCFSVSITRTEKNLPVGKVSEMEIAHRNTELTILQEKQSPVVPEMEDSIADVHSFHEQQDQDLSDEKPLEEMFIRRQQSDISDTSTDKPVLETLTFSASKLTQNADGEEAKLEADMEMCLCPLCDRAYTSDNKDVLAHLVLMHKFVIADVNYIASLPSYLRYWKVRFNEKPISEFCSKIVTNTGAKDQAPREEFYLLCDALPEDKSIREHLQKKKLESVLAQQQKEREETKFCRQCLFCKQTFCGNRAVLFDHLLRDHTFHVGQPDNLVYTDELFDLIQSKLDNQLCLFCEKSFKDKASLREHMRKKQHRKINPKNKEYDRFYIVNYMEMGKNWESLQSEDNRLIKSSEKDTDEEEEWSGWNEESDSKVVCLFCDSSCVVQTDLQLHMKEKHSFDLQEVNNRLQLNFYQKVKLINYIRRQVYHRTCYGCQQVFENKEKLHCHFDEFSDHIKKIPDSEAWDQPQYFFPTYEDDCLLCQLDDDDEGAAGDALGVLVIAETIPVTDTILKDQKLCHDLLKP
ncbi:unnamed protein product, partial [Candidula unifasciata]